MLRLSRLAKSHGRLTCRKDGYNSELLENHQPPPPAAARDFLSLKHRLPLFDTMQVTVYHFLKLLVVAILLRLTSSNVISRNASFPLSLTPIVSTGNVFMNHPLSRPSVPFEWQVPNSETKLIVVWYYRNMLSQIVYSSLIEALSELYVTALYDYGDMPVRADSYQQQRYGVSLDVTRYQTPETPILYYSTVMRTFLGVSQIYQLFERPCGLSLIVYEQGQKVAHASLTPEGSPSAA